MYNHIKELKNLKNVVNKQKKIMKRNVIKQDKNIQCSLGKNPSINTPIKK